MQVSIPCRVVDKAIAELPGTSSYQLLSSKIARVVEAIETEMMWFQACF